MRGAVAPIKNGQATCVFNAVPAGTYAVAVFHAEHNETQMETGLFGKPKQGYGFSNNPPGAVRTVDLSGFFAAFVSRVCVDRVRVAFRHRRVGEPATIGSGSVMLHHRQSLMP
jgi:uncharacterized protein (DUF2141 family)